MVNVMDIIDETKRSLARLSGGQQKKSSTEYSNGCFAAIGHEVMTEQSNLNSSPRHSNYQRIQAEIFLENLPKANNIQLLVLDYVKQFGNIKFVDIRTNKYGNKYAVVIFENEEGKTNAMKIDNHTLDGVNILVE